MNPKFNTGFFERYARESLVALLGPRYACLRNVDRPDLQDPTGGLGIEVTRAIDENRQTAEQLVNEMADRQIFDLSPDDLSSINRYGYAYGLQDSVIGRLEYDYWSLALPLRRIIQSKVHKVADGFYGDFQEFGLYIFSKAMLTPDELRLTMDFTITQQCDCKRCYSMLYMSQIQQLAVCDLRKKLIHYFEITPKQRRQFYRNALGI